MILNLLNRALVLCLTLSFLFGKVLLLSTYISFLLSMSLRPILMSSISPLDRLSGDSFIWAFLILVPLTVYFRVFLSLIIFFLSLLPDTDLSFDGFLPSNLSLDGFLSSIITNEFLFSLTSAKSFLGFKVLECFLNSFCIKDVVVSWLTVLRRLGDWNWNIFLLVPLPDCKVLKDVLTYMSL